MKRAPAIALFVGILAAVGTGFADVPLVSPQPVPLALQAEPVPLDREQPSLRRVGELVYAGGVHLTADSRDFGGLSGLRVSPEGRVIAVGDAGTWVGFSVVEQEGRLVGARDGRIFPVLGFARETGEKRDRDVEAVEISPDGQRVTISFERGNKLWTYASRDAFALDFATAIPVLEWAPPAMQLWPLNGGPEAMARFSPDGSLVVFAEEAEGPDGSLAAFVAGPRQNWDGTGSAAGATEGVIRFGYRPPQTFRPTDAVAVGDGTVLVLNRRFHPLLGVAAAITLVDLRNLREGVVVEGREIARLVPPVSVDNMEGISLVSRNGRRFIYLVSDDNFRSLQRTLLLKFEWRPAGSSVSP